MLKKQKWFSILSILIFLSTTQFGVAQMDSTKVNNSNDISWLVGHWEGEGFGGICEEDWQPMTAGTMCGTFKLIVKDKVVFYELMIISETDSGYSLNLKHFNSDMTGWEEKDKVISFPYNKVAKNKLMFHGLTYERIADDKLQIIVTTGHKDGTSDDVVIDCVKK